MTVSDLLAERRALIDEMRRETDCTARAVLKAEIAVIDSRIKGEEMCKAVSK